MRRLCAWCKRDLDTGDQLTDEEYTKLSEDASHGMCLPCYGKAVELPTEQYITHGQRKEFWRLFREEPSSDLTQGEAGRMIRQGQTQDKHRKISRK